VNKAVRIFALFVIAILSVSPVFAAPEAESAEGAGQAAQQEDAPAAGISILSAPALGAGLVILGAGFGISRIGAAAVESQARQPEVAGAIQTAMIIAAALIEGVTLFALIVCMMSIGK